MASGKPPEQVIGNYTLLDELGKGAFAHVYLAQNKQSGEYVAVKLLDERHRNSSGEGDLRQEGEILKYLQQFHYRYILSFIEQAEYSGRPYIVVQQLRAGTLRAQLTGELMDTGRAVTIIRQIGEAISTIHQHGLVHCDITPENILFDENNQAILTDFGIAIQLPPRINSIQVFPVRGTPLYMAPEQFEGIITRECDQYSLGCIAYELFTGTHPIEPITSRNINNMDFMKEQHSNKEPENPCTLNNVLEPFIGKATLKAIAKAPEERHEDVITFVKTLHQPLHFAVTTGSYARQVQIAGPAEVSTDLCLPENYFKAFLTLLSDLGYSRNTDVKGRSRHNIRKYTCVWKEGINKPNGERDDRFLLYIPEAILYKPSQTNLASISYIGSAFDEGSFIIIVSKLQGDVDGEIRRIIDEDWSVQGKKGKILPWRDVEELITYREEIKGSDTEQQGNEIIQDGIRRLLEMPK
jgi:serine/threonine protein kinase